MKVYVSMLTSAIHNKPIYTQVFMTKDKLIDNVRQMLTNVTDAKLYDNKAGNRLLSDNFINVIIDKISSHNFDKPWAKNYSQRLNYDFMSSDNVTLTNVIDYVDAQ